MKRIILSALSVLLILILASCGGAGEPSDTTASSGGVPSGPSVNGGAPSKEPVDRNAWTMALEYPQDANVTVSLLVNATDGSGFSRDGKYLLDGDRFQTEGNLTEEGLDATAVRARLAVLYTVLAFYDQFTFNAETGCYESIDELECGVTVSGIGATVTVWDAELSFDSNARISRLSCKMRQSATVDGAPFLLEMSLTATFSDYGTTVIQ